MVSICQLLVLSGFVVLFATCLGLDDRAYNRGQCDLNGCLVESESQPSQCVANRRCQISSRTLQQSSQSEGSNTIQEDSRENGAIEKIKDIRRIKGSEVDFDRTPEEVAQYRSQLQYVEVGRRPNILNGTHVYAGGFDIENKDYLASAFWYGFWIAVAGGIVTIAVWLAAFVKCFLACCCGQRYFPSPKPIQSDGALVCRLMLVIVSLVGVTGVILSLYGLGDIVTNRVDSMYKLASLKVTEVSDRMDDVSLALNDALKKSGELGQSGEMAVELRGFHKDVQLAAEEFRSTEDKLQQYRQSKDEKQLIFVVALLVMTSAAGGYYLAGVLGATFMSRRFVDLLYLCAPLLVALCFAATVIAAYAYPISHDGCLELGNFLINPANSTLSNFLTCPDSSTNEIRIKDGMRLAESEIAQINSHITRLNTAFGVVPSFKPMPQICPLFKDGKAVSRGACPEGYVPVSEYQAVLDGQVCTSDPGAMDKLAQGFLSGQTPSLSKLVGNKCILEGKPLGEETHDSLSTTRSLAESIQKVLGDMQGLVKCDVYDEAAVVVQEEVCPHVEADLILAVVGYGLAVAASLAVYVVVPPTARRFKAGKRELDKEYQFSQY